MAFITELPSNVITVDGSGVPIVNVGSNNILNDFYGPSSSVGEIRADSDDATADAGEQVFVDTAGGEITGTYAGPVTISTANVTVSLAGIEGINVGINPVSGHLIAGDDGTAYVVSDSALSADNLGATATISIGGTTVGAQAPLSQLNGALITNVNTAGQAAYQAAYNTSFNSQSPAIPLAVRQTTAALAGTTAQAPFNLVATTLQASATAIQTTANLAVINVSVGTGTLEVTPVCFVRGTMIMTEQGEVPIEDLKAGDMVLTMDHGFQPIRWIGSTRLSALDLIQRPNLRPIRIQKGAFGPNLPEADLSVSPQHRVLIRSKVADRIFATREVLVAAKQLLQLPGINVESQIIEVEYFHMMFSQHEVVYANGLLSESLYLGPVSMQALEPAAREEISALFPGVFEGDRVFPPARHLASGRLGRRLAVRHLQNGKNLFEPA
ncbi:Hint domain-containing protein [Falsirhodobacter halotolerans]|uniref:Hint domain-containing protein n=1 Tax=Falsirhodobacter halotolerans TaxID=1146892 RepID=UPI001FD22A11|nr:Hint domain-containing protein [Falsirhodobacter halotolerans]MCJ8139543.1 Hint domain-containing protein [Falsirhodobacter halotolerans]